jgi:hypothetical protein
VRHEFLSSGGRVVREGRHGAHGGFVRHETPWTVPHGTEEARHQRRQILDADALLARRQQLLRHDGGRLERLVNRRAHGDPLLLGQRREAPQQRHDAVDVIGHLCDGSLQQRVEFILYGRDGGVGIERGRSSATPSARRVGWHLQQRGQGAVIVQSPPGQHGGGVGATQLRRDPRQLLEHDGEEGWILEPRAHEALAHRAERRPRRLVRDQHEALGDGVQRRRLLALGQRGEPQREVA